MNQHHLIVYMDYRGVHSSPKIDLVKAIGGRRHHLKGSPVAAPPLPVILAVQAYRDGIMREAYAGNLMGGIFVGEVPSL